MTVVGVGSVHGSPGATTLALALAHHLPTVSGHDSLVVEADPDGGRLAIRHELGRPAGLTALAGAARTGIAGSEVLRFAVPMPSGIPVIVAHPAAEQVHAALRAAGQHVAAALREAAAERALDIVIDLGRLRPGSPAQPLAAVCDVLLVVTRPMVEHLVALAERLDVLRSMAPVEVAMIGERPYGAAEVQRVLDVPAVHVITADARGVLADPAGAVTRRRSWGRSVAALAAAVAEPDAVEPASSDEPGTALQAV